MSRAAPLEVGRRGLDQLLGGGVPRGQVVEVSGSSSSGKSTLAFGVCLRALERGQAAAWIETGGGFWPVAAVEAGVPLDKLLVVKVKGGTAALRAAHILLSSAGAVAALVVDFPLAATVRERELVALQRLAERSSTALLFLTARPRTAPSLGAAVALRLHAERRTGGRVRIEVLRNKQGASHRSIEEMLEERPEPVAEVLEQVREVAKAVRAVPEVPEAVREVAKAVRAVAEVAEVAEVVREVAEVAEPVREVAEVPEGNDGPDRVRAGSAL